MIDAIGLEGIEGYVIEVAVKVLGGPRLMNIIGLGDMAIKEAKDRIEAVLDHYDFEFPKGKIVVSLSPCDLKKSGSYLDLAMVLAILVQTNQLQAKANLREKTVFLGAVGLSGELIGFRGVLPMVVFARKMGYKCVVLPRSCLAEAQVCTGIELIGLETVMEVLKWVEGRLTYRLKDKLLAPLVDEKRRLDYAQVQGQDSLLEFVVAAAAGSHNMLLVGPPGCGKSMIAKRLPTILPNLSEEEALEVLALHSLSGKNIQEVLGGQRPFRAPHYNASANAIIGGGTHATPGEVSLAHHGVLFLDELTEFTPKVIDSLRQPLEDGVVTVARVRSTHTYPARFMFVGAMNPCKCGYYGYAKCSCSAQEIRKYQRRVSGPVYDRMDIQKFMGPVSARSSGLVGKMTSGDMSQRVVQARKLQSKRFESIAGVFANAHMKDDLIGLFCVLTPEAQEYMDDMSERFRFSRRAYDKVLMLSRTFADLLDEEFVQKSCVEQALMGRDLDREVSVFGE